MDSASQLISVDAGVTSEVWRGLEVVGDLEATVTHLAEDLHSNILDPLLACSSSSTTIDIALLPRRICRWESSCEAGENEHGIPSKLNGIEAILKFIAEYLFLDIGTLLFTAGETIWEKLQHRIEREVIYII